MFYGQKKNTLPGFGNNGQTFLTFPPILLIAAVIGLMVMMVSACIRFTKGPLSTTALLQQLKRLQAKFTSAAPINPEFERGEMEKLQNKIKTSSDPAIISANADLKQLFHYNCEAIQVVLRQPDLDNRMSWIKLNALMIDFNSLYFEKQGLLVAVK